MSEDIYAKNLDCLQKAYPELAEKIESLPEAGAYEVLPATRKNEPNLLYKDSGAPVVFYNENDPCGNIDHWAARVLGGNTRLAVLLGFGLGYTAEGLLRNSPHLFKAIVVEKDAACLKAAMSCRDLTPILGNTRFKLVVGYEKQDFYVLLHNALRPHFPGLKELKFLPWPASIRIAPDYYRFAVRTFCDIADNYGGERGNDPYDTLVSYEHFFQNIEHLMRSPGAAHVKNLFKGRPAVVVATGPSLKKNIHQLKSIENSALILSVDASLRILHQHNIFPHLVTTIERPPGFDAYYKGLKNLDKTVFAVVSFAHPSTIAAYTGPLLFFHRAYNFMEQLGFKPDTIHMGMSTANMAYEVARHMGCNPIILVGNDLAFDSTGRTHAQGFILGEKQPLYEDFDRFDVPGNVQPLVKTCDGWHSCLKQYEHRIEGWSGKLINATEGGAKIRGAEVMALQEAIVQHCTEAFYPREALQTHMPHWQNPRRPEDLLRILDNYLQTIDRFTQIALSVRKLLDTTVQEIESAKSLTPALRKRIREAIPQVETILSNIPHSELMLYAEEYIYSDIFPLLMEWQVIRDRFADPDWADAYRLKLAENYFGGLGQLCISLKEALLDGQRRLVAISS